MISRRELFHSAEWIPRAAPDDLAKSLERADSHSRCAQGYKITRLSICADRAEPLAHEVSGSALPEADVAALERQRGEGV